MNLNQVNILGIANRWHMELEKRCSASKGKVFLKIRMIKDFYKGTADNQILFNLTIMGPRGGLLPLGDKVIGDQMSASTVVLTITFHGFRLLIPSTCCDGASGVGAGFFSTRYFTKATVLSWAPTRSSR